MKKLLFILICLSIIGFYSCDSNKPEWRKNKEKYNKIMKEERIAKEEMMRKYEKIVKKELQKDTIISNIFLDFKYGESKESVNQKTSNLLANGKISKWLETDTLVYKFLYLARILAVLIPLTFWVTRPFYWQITPKNC